MSTPTASLLEMRLSAFVDSEVSDAEKQDIESVLVNDPMARSLQDELKRGTDRGRRLFDDMLKEPVPLDLVRGIKNASLPRKAIRLPGGTTGATLTFRPTALQSVAGGLVMLLIGAGIGYMAGMQPPGTTSPAALPSQTQQARDWLDDVVSHYRLYARQEQNHVVEIEAGKPAEIREWLTTGTGVSFRIPDLADSGLTFLGARLVAAENTPTGLLLYRRIGGDSDGEIIALTISRARPETTKPVEDIRLDTGLVTWSTPLATYVLVGPSSAADLDDIAAKAAGLI